VKSLEDMKNVLTFVAPELFFLYGDEGSENLLQVMQQKQLYSMAVDAYVMGWIEEKIWKEKWDP